MTLGEIIPVEPYDFLIHVHDSKFKVKRGSDSTTVYESTNLTDALPAFEYCRDQMGLNGMTTWIKNYAGSSNYYPFSGPLTFNTPSHARQKWLGMGDWMAGRVRMMALNNTPILSFDSTSGGYQCSFGGLWFNHAQSGYTSSLVYIKDFAVELAFKDIYAYDSGTYKGNLFGLECLNTVAPLPSQYKISFENIDSYGFENVFYVNNNVPVVGGNNSMTSFIFDKIFAWNCKRVALATGASGAQFLAPHFSNVFYQYSSANPLSSGEAVYDYGSSLQTFFAKHLNCMTWDIPAGANVVNAGSSTELMLMNSNGIERVGGSGASKVKSLDYYNHASGVFETPAVLGQRDYTITHNLGKIPKTVLCTVSNQEINNQFACHTPKDQVTTTTFKARLLGYPIPTSGNNLKFSWWVIY